MYYNFPTKGNFVYHSKRKCTLIQLNQKIKTWMIIQLCTLFLFIYYATHCLGKVQHYFKQLCRHLQSTIPKQFHLLFYFPRSYLVPLNSSSNINGIIFTYNQTNAATTKPKFFSQEDSCPNRYTSLNPQTKQLVCDSTTPWNPYGEQLGHKEYLNRKSVCGVKKKKIIIKEDRIKVRGLHPNISSPIIVCILWPLLQKSFVTTNYLCSTGFYYSSKGRTYLSYVNLRLNFYFHYIKSSICSKYLT